MEPSSSHAEAFRGERAQAPSGIGIRMYIPILEVQVKAANDNGRQAGFQPINRRRSMRLHRTNLFCNNPKMLAKAD